MNTHSHPPDKNGDVRPAKSLKSVRSEITALNRVVEADLRGRTHAPDDGRLPRLAHVRRTVNSSPSSDRASSW